MLSPHRCSTWQVGSHPSRARRLPSSQPSPDSTIPLPQRLPSPHAASHPSPGVQLPSSQVSPGSSMPFPHRVPKAAAGLSGPPSHSKRGLKKLSVRLPAQSCPSAATRPESDWAGQQNPGAMHVVATLERKNWLRSSIVPVKVTALVPGSDTVRSKPDWLQSCRKVDGGGGGKKSFGGYVTETRQRPPASTSGAAGQPSRISNTPS